MVTAVMAFALVAGMMTVIPGIDTALVLRTAARFERRAGFAVAAGVCVGCLLWGVAAALGVSALLTASEVAFTALRTIGAVYMVFLGVRMVIHGFRADMVPAAAEVALLQGRSGLWRFFRQGLMTNLLNPKVGAFYIALLPQFVPADQPPVLAGGVLALVHGVEGMLWFTVLIVLVDRMSDWLRRPRVQRVIDTAAGLTVIGFGLKLAATRD